MVEASFSFAFGLSFMILPFLATAAAAFVRRHIYGTASHFQAAIHEEIPAPNIGKQAGSAEISTGMVDL